MSRVSAPRQNYIMLEPGIDGIVGSEPYFSSFNIHITNSTCPHTT